MTITPHPPARRAGKILLPAATALTAVGIVVAGPAGAAPASALPNPVPTPKVPAAIHVPKSRTVTDKLPVKVPKEAASAKTTARHALHALVTATAPGTNPITGPQGHKPTASSPGGAAPHRSTVDDDIAPALSGRAAEQDNSGAATAQDPGGSRTDTLRVGSAVSALHRSGQARSHAQASSDSAAARPTSILLTALAAAVAVGAALAIAARRRWRRRGALASSTAG